MESTNSRILELESIKSENEEELTSLRIQKTELQNTITNIQSQLESANVSISQLAAQKQNLEDQITSLNGEIETLNTETESLHTTIATLQGQLSAYEKYSVSIDTNALDSILISDLDLNVTYQISNLTNNISLYPWQSIQIAYISDGNIFAVVNGTQQDSNVITLSGVSGDSFNVSSIYVAPPEPEEVIVYEDFFVNNGVVTGCAPNVRNLTIPASYSLSDLMAGEVVISDLLELENFIKRYGYNFSCLLDDVLVVVGSQQDYYDYEFDIHSYLMGSNPLTISYTYRQVISGNDYPITSIGANAFFQNSQLTSVELPEGLLSIGNLAFQSCTSLSSINIPSTVTSIGNAAFYVCINLNHITLPEGLTQIGYHAFGKSGLYDIVIPSTVAYIGNDSFSDCRNLGNVTILASTPPQLEVYAFSDTNCTFYVYPECINDYCSANVWSELSSRIESLVIDSVYESNTRRVSLYDNGAFVLENKVNGDVLLIATFSLDLGNGNVRLYMNGDTVLIYPTSDLSSFVYDGETFSIVV